MDSQDIQRTTTGLKPTPQRHPPPPNNQPPQHPNAPAPMKAAQLCVLGLAVLVGGLLIA